MFVFVQVFTGQARLNKEECSEEAGYHLEKERICCPRDPCAHLSRAHLQDRGTPLTSLFMLTKLLKVGQRELGGGGSRGSLASSGLEVSRDLRVGEAGQSRLKMTRRHHWILTLGVLEGHAGWLLHPRKSSPLRPGAHQARPALAPEVLVGVRCC